MLCRLLSAPVASAGQPAAKAQVVGGTPADVPIKSSVCIDLTNNNELVSGFGKSAGRIP
jgi:hypothetical protein